MTNDELRMGKSIKNRGNNFGFTLIEVLVGSFILLIVSMAAVEGFVAVSRIVSAARVKTDAMLIANEQIELIRNMPYNQIGIVGGLPAGLIPREKIVSGSSGSFTLTTSIRNIDDPFDGKIGGTPNDLSPTDYRLVEVTVDCDTCRDFIPQRVTTTIASRNLETATGNGALFVRAIDATGAGVVGADVLIEKIGAGAFTVNETTNNNGEFQLVDAPPANGAYHIRFSKDGYSTSQNYVIGGVGNPNPIAKYATVLAGQVTSASFSIDRLSRLNIKTLDNQCQAVGNVSFNLRGDKKIGTEPDVYKYNQDKSTDSSGELDLPNMEWDTYNLSLLRPTGSEPVLAGSLSTLPLVLNPDTEQEMSMIVVPNDPNSLLVTVKDAPTGLPLSEALVTLSLGSDSWSRMTSRGFWRQTDWQGGSGQTDFISSSRFAESDDIDFTGTTGEIRLRESLGQYVSSGYLISSILDTGTAGDITYTILSWEPGSQATSTGSESVKIQLASAPTNTATTTWNFVGPDGTAGSYYTVTGSSISPVHGNDRYVRYKIILATDDLMVTPNISDISLTYSSSCLPYGQVFFSGLDSSDFYVLTVSHNGYQTQVLTIPITSSWQDLSIGLQPE